MKKLIALTCVAVLGLTVVGCSGADGTNADRAQATADMEKRVNDQALKDKPPPPGEGPGN